MFGIKQHLTTLHLPLHSTTFNSSLLFNTNNNNNYYYNTNNYNFNDSSNQNAIISHHDFAYPDWQLVIIISTCALTISGTILGNVLVCTAVAIVRKLRTPSNLLIVSLAVSDLLVAVLVMPLATAYEVKGRWVFGQPLCDMWTSLDVLLCTSSILNLCMISIDRYFVITRPFQYAMKRTPARMTLMILSVWMLSALISIPPLFGWKEPPKPDQCNITQNIGYQFYATIGAFYLPLVVMVIIYYRIYQVSSRITEAEARSKPTNGHHTVNPTQSKPLLPQQSIKHKTLRCLHGSLPGEQTNETTTRNWARLQKVKLLQRFHVSNGCPSGDLRLVSLRNNSKSPSRRSIGEVNRSSCKLLARQKSSISSFTAVSKSGVASVQSANASSLSKECKATKTLGVIMGTFIACWLPFFILALIKPFCSQPVDSCIPHWLSALFLWLGFANSFLNPIIYARFNREFRKPFREILLLRCRDINRRLRSDTYAEQFGPPSQDRLMVGVGHSHYSSAATLTAARPNLLPGKTLLKSAVVHYQSVQDRAVTKLNESCEIVHTPMLTGGRKEDGKISENETRDSSSSSSSSSSHSNKLLARNEDDKINQKITIDIESQNLAEFTRNRENNDVVGNADEDNDDEK